MNLPVRVFWPALLPSLLLSCHAGVMPVADSPERSCGPDAGPSPQARAIALVSVRGSRHEVAVTCLAYSQDGRILASGDADGSIRIWDTAGGRLIHDLTARGSIRGVSLSPDGKRMASTDDYGFLWIWDLDTGQVLQKARGSNFVRYWRDGRLLLTSLSFNDAIGVRVVDASSGETVHEFGSPLNPMESGAVSPDDSMLAAPTIWGTIQLMDTTTWAAIRQLKDPDRSPGGVGFSLAFTPDGKLLVSADTEFWEEDSVITVWDPSNGELLRSFEPRKGIIDEIRVSPDGKLVAAWGGRRSKGMEGLRIWSIDSGEEVLVIEDDRGAVYSAAFSPDGRTIATTGGDWLIRFWDVSDFSFSGPTSPRSSSPQLRTRPVPPQGEQDTGDVALEARPDPSAEEQNRVEVATDRLARLRATGWASDEDNPWGDLTDVLLEPRDPRVIPPLIECFGGPLIPLGIHAEDSNYSIAGDVITRLDLLAVEPLLQALSHDHRRVRAFSARLLGAIRPAGIEEALVHGLRDPDPDVRFEVIYALGAIGSPNAVAPLSGIVNDMEVVQRRLPYLRWQPLPRGIDYKLQWVDSRLAYLRSSTSRIINASDDWLGLARREVPVGWAAIQVLHAAGEELTPETVDVAWRAPSHWTHQGIVTMGLAPWPGPELQDWVNEARDPYLRGLLAELGLREGRPGAAAALDALARHGDAIVRLYALQTLGELRPVASRDLMLAALQSGGRYSRQVAASALVGVEGEGITRALVERLADPDGFVLRAAAAALQEREDPAMPGMILDLVARLEEAVAKLASDELQEEVPPPDPGQEMEVFPGAAFTRSSRGFGVDPEERAWVFWELMPDRVIDGAAEVLVVELEEVFSASIEGRAPAAGGPGETEESPRRARDGSRHSVQEMAAALILAAVGGKSPLPTFRLLLDHPEAFFRRCGIYGLGLHGDEADIPTLRRLATARELGNVREFVARQARWALVRLAGPDALEEVSGWVFDLGLRSIELGPLLRSMELTAIRPAMARALDRRRPSFRWSWQNRECGLLLFLGAEGSPEALEAIRSYMNRRLTDPEAEVLMEVLEGVEGFPWAEILDGIRELYNPESLKHYQMLVGRLKPKGYQGIILVDLESEYPSTRLVAISAMRETGDAAFVSALRERARSDADADVRREARLAAHFLARPWPLPEGLIADPWGSGILHDEDMGERDEEGSLEDEEEE